MFKNRQSVKHGMYTHNVQCNLNAIKDSIIIHTHTHMIQNADNDQSEMNSAGATLKTMAMVNYFVRLYTRDYFTLVSECK